MIKACADIMIQCLIVGQARIDPEEAVRIVRGAIRLYDLIFPDGAPGCSIAT